MQMLLRFIYLFILFVLVGCHTNAEWFTTSQSDAEEQEEETSTNSSANDEEDVEISSLSLNYNSPLILRVGQTSQLMLTVQLSNGEYEYNITSDLESDDLSGDVVWFSNDRDVISVDSVGVIMAMNSGQTTVKADLLGFSDTLDIVVQEPEEVTLTQLNFHDDSLESSDGQVFTVTLDATLSDGTTYSDFTAEDSTLDCSLIFSSSHEDIATISSTGLVTPVDNGSTNLTVECGDISALAVLTVSGFTDEEEILDGKDDAQDEEVEVIEEVLSISIITDPSEWVTGETITLQADITFNTGTVENVTNRFISPQGELLRLGWASSDTTIISISNGVASLFDYGSVTLTASLEGVSSILEAKVYLASDELDWDDNFLTSADDLSNITYGTNGGYGSPWYPTIVYGSAVSGGTHVVSFGGGGRLILELVGREIVDGPGVDFTIFENPVINSYYGYFAERATVGVSEDGVSFEYFDCDYDDESQVYAGCAGINPVDAGENPLDSSVSGGDFFDLEEVGLERAKFISIEDMDTCTSDDPTYYTTTGSLMCAYTGTQGFDLDAIALIHVQYE